MDQFKDKVVIVTGGSEGVGAATARAFANSGAKLLLVARSKRNLEAVAEPLRSKTDVEIVAMDVCDEDACVNLFKKAEYEFGAVNVLVNNAGFHERGPVEDVAADDLCRMVDVNLKAPIYLCRTALPCLKKAEGLAAIVNVASLAGRTPVPGAATYSATKFALRAFTFALAEELRDTSIKLAAVSPGPIETGFILDNIDNVTDLTFSQPMSTADDVAGEILALCVNGKRERSMPPISGGLTTLTYLLPWIGRKMKPALEKRGREVKKRYKTKLRRAAKDETT